MSLFKYVFFAVLLALSSSLWAQNYPDKPIRIVVPFPPGGGVDLFARTLGKKLGDSLKQSVIIENRAGAAGIIGTELVAKAAPDGYTLVIATQGPMTIAGGAGRKLNYEPLKDFAPITMGAWITPIVVTSGDSSITNVKTLIAAAKAQPGIITYASGGIGTSQHLATEMFSQLAGITMNHVPFQGAAPAFTAIASGQVNVYFSDPSAVGLVQSGKLKAIAVSSPARYPKLPNVPTVSESGLTGFVYQNWYGIAAPAKTPAAIINLLNKEFRLALESPEVRETLANAGMDIAPGSPEAFGIFLERDQKNWAEVIKNGAIKFE
jgi:tripartite-type tricarboxylate transporter receptor subunit TctC